MIHATCHGFSRLDQLHAKAYMGLGDSICPSAIMWQTLQCKAPPELDQASSNVHGHLQLLSTTHLFRCALLQQLFAADKQW